MSVSGIGPSDVVGAGLWIQPRLATTFGAVCRTIPTGFEAYARVLHPADTGGTGPGVHWSEIAEANGRLMHALAQYERISTPLPDRDPDRDADEATAPRRGYLEPELLAELTAILQRHTTTATDCYFALWGGYGWLPRTSRRWLITTEGQVEVPVPPQPFATLEPSDVPLALPGRSYLLFAGSITSSGLIGRWHDDNWFSHASPNLMWPRDLSWCVASEIDFDSTLVGGSAELIADVLANTTLEAWPVEPGDSLAWDGDHLNVD